MAQGKQKLKEQKLIWWKLLSASSALAGILEFINNIGSDRYGAFAGLIINLVLAVGLWNQSLLVFNLYRIIIIFSFFLIIVGTMDGVYEGEDIAYFGTIEAFTILANITLVISLVALWIQLKKAKKINW